MQETFDFGAVAEIASIRAILVDAFGHLTLTPVRDPTSQLVKSLISGRTRDAVSLGAFTRLVAAYRRWDDVADAPPRALEAAIADVTFADDKARHLGEALRIVRTRDPRFRLDFLSHWPMARALAWLERLPGVGRKVSASTLNFSTFRQPAFVVDSHVLRVLRRFGLVRPEAPTERAYDAVMAATEGWRASDLVELHCLLKRLGQTACRPEQPRCTVCPLRRMCRFAGAGAMTVCR